jgi:chromosome segregation ATPase
MGGEVGTAVMFLAGQIELASAALVGLSDQITAAEDELAGMEKALKPTQKAFDAATRAVDALKEAFSDLSSEMANIGGGGIELPGEHEVKQNIFGLQNAINILEQRKRELARGGVAKDDPRMKQIDEEIKRNREELEYQQGKLKAEYDGQRNALDEAAKAGGRIVQSFEQQYERIVAIYAEQQKINTEQLPAALALQTQAREQLEGQTVAIEAQQALIDLLKVDYESLKKATEEWKTELDKVLENARRIRDTLRDAVKAKEKLKAAVEGPTTAAPITINNTIDARGNGLQQVEQATGESLAVAMRTRLISGVL